MWFWELLHIPHKKPRSVVGLRIRCGGVMPTLLSSKFRKRAWGQVFDFEFRLFKFKNLTLWILNEYLRAIKNPVTQRVTGFKYIC